MGEITNLTTNAVDNRETHIHTDEYSDQEIHAIVESNEKEYPKIN